MIVVGTKSDSNPVSGQAIDLQLHSTQPSIAYAPPTSHQQQTADRTVTGTSGIALVDEIPRDANIAGDPVMTKENEPKQATGEARYAESLFNCRLFLV